MSLSNKTIGKHYADNEIWLLNQYFDGRIPKGRLIAQLEKNKKCYIAQVLQEPITYYNIKNNYNSFIEGQDFFTITRKELDNF